MNVVKNTTKNSQSKETSFSDLIVDAEMQEFLKDDPVTALLLSGKASTVHEAERKFLDENVEAICKKVLKLVESNLSDEDFSRQPLIMLLRGHGSRRWEDSLV